MSSNTSGDIVLVVDQMRLRRAQLIHFLRTWSAQEGLSIAERDTAEITKLTQPPACRIQLFNIGADPVGDPTNEAVFRVLSAVCPTAPVVFLGESADVDRVRFALRLGAAGYIPCSLDADVALAALSFVLAGGCFFPPDALRIISEHFQGPHEPIRARIAALPSQDSEGGKLRPADKPSGNGTPTQEVLVPRPSAIDSAGSQRSDLTTRQEEVLQRLLLGQSNKEIARELDMSEATVKVHVRQVMKRLGVHNRTQAAVFAANLRIPEPDEVEMPRASASILSYVKTVGRSATRP